MTTQTTSPRPALSPETARGIWMWLFKAACLPPFIAAMLFLPTGRTWPMGWAHVGLYLVWLIIYGAVLIPRSPDLVADRSRMQRGSKKWDVALSALAASFLPLASWIVAGLDMGSGWSPPVPLWALIPAGVIVVLLIVRTALEDRTLRAELPGYADYAQETRYRILPGVW